MLGLNSCPRTKNLDIKVEFVRSYVSTKICARAVGCPRTGLPDRRALRGHDTRVTAERPAACRHLGQKQRRRHQRTDAVESGANITLQAHHSLAARQSYDVKTISGDADQWLG